MVKRRKQTVYTGELDEFLPALPTPFDEDFEVREKEHDQAYEERVDLLFEFHAVDRNDPQAWRKLAEKLMTAHVKGFQYVEPRSDVDRFIEIIFNVEYLVRKHGVTPEQASSVLSGLRPSLGKSGSISHQYFEMKRHPMKGSMLRFLQRSSETIGEDKLLWALETEVFPEVRAIENLPRNKRGRPKKK